MPLGAPVIAYLVAGQATITSLAPHPQDLLGRVLFDADVDLSIALSFIRSWRACFAITSHCSKQQSSSSGSTTGDESGRASQHRRFLQWKNAKRKFDSTMSFIERIQPPITRVF
jgi:hypothetical protein